MYTNNLLRRQVYNEKKKRNLVFYTILVIVSVYLLWSLVFDENGLIRYYELKEKKSALIKEIASLNNETSRLQEEVELLKKDPFYIEKKAREELNMSKPDEYIFLFEK
ncbi:MAG TPA: septum formation initiator family protein [Nitrospirae bacterium]|nr:septum formation initiator family protein [Nitrospirota bacterium]